MPPCAPALHLRVPHGSSLCSSAVCCRALRHLHRTNPTRAGRGGNAASGGSQARGQEAGGESQRPARNRLHRRDAGPCQIGVIPVDRRPVRGSEGRPDDIRQRICRGSDRRLGSRRSHGRAGSRRGGSGAAARKIAYAKEQRSHRTTIRLSALFRNIDERSGPPSCERSPRTPTANAMSLVTRYRAVNGSNTNQTVARRRYLNRDQPPQARTYAVRPHPGHGYLTDKPSSSSRRPSDLRRTTGSFAGDDSRAHQTRQSRRFQSRGSAAASIISSRAGIASAACRNLDKA